MNEPSLEQWAERLTLTARALPYPPTPNVAVAISGRLAAATGVAAATDVGARPARPAGHRWQLALLALAVVVLGLLAAAPVRAALVQFIQIGVVRIFVGPATATPAPAATPIAAGTSAAGTATSNAAPTSVAAPTPATSLLPSLAGETTLAGAQTQAGFPVLLPAYPSDLGPPDHVFLQNDGGALVMVVWLDPAQPGRPRLALFEIAPGSIGLAKSEFSQGVPPQLQTTTVHGQPAAWTTGPYVLRLTNGDYSFDRVIDGHVLIWLDRGLTYRLELGISASLAEAVKIAESLR